MLFNLIKKFFIMCFIVILLFSFAFTAEAKTSNDHNNDNKTLNEIKRENDSDVLHIRGSSLHRLLVPNYSNSFGIFDCTYERKDKSYKLDLSIRKLIKSDSELAEYNLYSPEDCEKLLNYRKHVLEHILLEKIPEKKESQR